MSEGVGRPSDSSLLLGKVQGRQQLGACSRSSRQNNNGLGTAYSANLEDSRTIGPHSLLACGLPGNKCEEK